MIISYARGHKIIFYNNAWLYADNRNVFDDSRPCIRCGDFPDSNGHDACLGHIKGVEFACCGHGIDEYKYIIKQGG